MTNRERPKRKPVLVEWKGAEIMESRMKPGARYAFSGAAIGVTEFIATTEGWSVQVLSGCKPCFVLVRQGSAAGGHPVTILDWPSHCGPRPDAKPTWKQIVEGAPSPEAAVVFVKNGSEVVGAQVSYFQPHNYTPDAANGTFLGYLVWEPTE